MPTQKLYVYADESGQDASSLVFLVVAIASEQDQGRLRERLLRVEGLAGTWGLKWRKTESERRLEYLETVLAKKIGHGDVFFGVYPKPTPYFLPLLDVVDHAIRRRARLPYTARVHVDGIDRKKAAELTAALREQGLRLEPVRSRRDESEPLIRLADMWAGCIRGAALGRTPEREMLQRARTLGYLADVGQENTP